MLRAHKVLLCALAGVAARGSLKGPKSLAAFNQLQKSKAVSTRAVSDAMSKIAALIQGGRADVAETPAPEAMDVFVQAISTLLTEITNEVLPKIEEGHTATQTEIDERLQAVVDKTEANGVRDREADARTAEGAWYGCVKTEKSLRESVEQAVTNLANAEAAKVAPCDAQTAAAPFTANPTSPNFHCDIEVQGGSCESELAKYEETIGLLETNLKNDLEGKRKVYTDAKKLCDDAKALIVTKQGDLTAATGEWSGQKSTCLGKREDLEVAMCNFGTALYHKCGAVDSYNQLIEAIHGEDNEWSHSDRAVEWNVTKVTECMLQGIAGGGAIDQFALDYCDSITDFDASFSLDEKTTSFQAQTSGTAPFYSCSETAIPLTGQSWQLPAAAVYDAPPSQDYVDIPSGFSWDINPKASPSFSFCSSGGGGGPGK